MPNRQGNPMTDLIKRLRSLAEKATPGPWEVGTHPSMVVAPCPCCGLVATAAQYGPSESAECYNSEYIAAANPLAVLELLDMIEKLRAGLAKHYEPLRLRAECVPGGFSESPAWCVICKGRGEPGKTIGSIRHTPDCPVTLAAGE